MKAQHYKTHRRLIPLYHGFVFFLILSILIGSGVNLVKSTGTDNIYSASLVTAIAVVLIFMFFYSRIFALRAQDRAIRAEENLRHFILTGKPLDPKITIRQVIALRFAQDEEFILLAKMAADTNMKADDIKRQIKEWKADHHRA